MCAFTNLMTPRSRPGFFRTLPWVLIFLVTASLQAESARLKVLIVDGQNNHAWATTTPVLRRILEETGLFAVDVTTTPTRPIAPRLPHQATPAQQAEHAAQLKQFAAAEAEYLAEAPARWAQWRPEFNRYAVVVSNYNGEDWPPEVRTAFVAYVRRGGGFVSYHAANNAFPAWPEYNEMIGLGGWGDRTEISGPYLRLRQGAWSKDASPGIGGSHGAQHEFLIVAFTPEHPILRGLPPQWMHAKDELYDSLRGPANHLTVLASALSDRTKEQEPMLMALQYGAGRIFHTTLGHGIDALLGLGFQVTFQRGTEWAATGRVTLPPPAVGELTVTQAALRPVNLP